MEAKLSIILLTLCWLSITMSAQPYAIPVTQNANLRAA